MKLMLTALLCAGLATLAGCSDQDDPATTPTTSHTADHQHADTHTAQVPGPDAATASAESAAYPVDYCVVSGEKLGEMGDIVEVVIDGRTVKLCCTMCEADLRADPAKYLAMLDSAAKGNDVRPTEGDDHDGDRHHAE